MPAKMSRRCAMAMRKATLNPPAEYPDDMGSKSGAAAAVAIGIVSQQHGQTFNQSAQGAHE